MKDYYAILGVSPDASVAAVRRAWRRASFKWHPDRNLHQKEVAHRRFLDLSEAWAILGNAALRRDYDLRRKGIEPPERAPWAEDDLKPEPGQDRGTRTEPSRPASSRPRSHSRLTQPGTRRLTREELQLWRMRVRSLARELAMTDRRGRFLDAWMIGLWISLFLVGLGGFAYMLRRAYQREPQVGDWPVWSPLLLLLAAFTARVWMSAFREARVDRYRPVAAEILERAGQGLARDGDQEKSREAPSTSESGSQMPPRQ